MCNFKNNKIHLIKKDQYSNSTCATYQDLISFAGISAKVEKVIIVFTQIPAIQADQLPKSTFGKDMAIEARGRGFGWGWHSNRLPHSSL